MQISFTRWHRMLVVVLAACLALGMPLVEAQSADAPQATATPAMPATPQTPPSPILRVGSYFGVLTNQSLLVSTFEPWRGRPQSSYLLDGHAIYTAYRFERVPIDLEIEGGIAKRFGNRAGGQQVEFDLIPMLRWKYLPWNDYLYTNIRLGLIGASYTTGVSQFERQFDSSGHSARFLNFLVTEITFAPNASSLFEVFVRMHHRSGIYGLIDHVHGASNYIAGGIRFGIF